MFQDITSAFVGETEENHKTLFRTAVTMSRFQTGIFRIQAYKVWA